MGLWFAYVYNLEVTYIEVWYNLNGSYIKSCEKAWLNRSEWKLLAMADVTLKHEWTIGSYIKTCEKAWLLAMADVTLKHEWTIGLAPWHRYWRQFSHNIWEE